jgi:hypothetical protein
MAARHGVKRVPEIARNRRPTLAKYAVDGELAKQIRPLVDRNLTVDFYDLTTVRIHGAGGVEEDLRAYWMNRETGDIARQFVMGVVQTADDLLP